MAYVACGRLDAYFNYGFNAWDMAASTFLIIEAGGKATSLSGGDDYLFKQNCLATNGLIHDRILDLWKKSGIHDLPLLGSLTDSEGPHC